MDDQQNPAGQPLSSGSSEPISVNPPQGGSFPVGETPAGPPSNFPKTTFQPAAPSATPVQPPVTTQPIPQIQVQPQTVVSPVPATTVVHTPGESAGQVHQRIVQSEQLKEVKQIKRTYKLENAVGVLFGAVETSLAIRLAFKLLGAKATNAFVSVLYQFTGIFANPFDGIFGKNPGFGRFELDIAAIIAMVVFAVVGFGALQLTKLF